MAMVDVDGSSHGVALVRI